MEECGETIDEEVKIVSDSKNRCSSCIFVHCVIFYFFTINVGIGAYFVYFYWYLKKDSPHVYFNTHKETTIY